MARPRRIALGGYCYHVLNRGNGRQTVFHKEADYEAFLALFDAAQKRCPMRVLSYCLMPNHFHLVLWPRGDGDLGRWMQWLLTTHVRRYHQHYNTSGHIWQGRFKAFPIAQDEHLLTVMRYVERNPFRAGLCDEVDGWRWSSLSAYGKGGAPAPGSPAWLDIGPAPRGRQWLRHVAQPQTDVELLALRHCIERGRPFGDPTWSGQAVAAMNLQSSLRPRGRPRKVPSDNEA